MAIVQMKSELQPLCPLHYKPMVFAQLLFQVHTDILPKPCYACEQAGCLYHYDIISGYFTIREEEHMERDMVWWLTCAQEGLPLYIADFEPQKSKRTWRCAQLGCIGCRTTEGVLPTL